MKKILFCGAIALAVLFTACNKSEVPAADNVKKDVVSKILNVSYSAAEDNSQNAPQWVKQLMQKVKSDKTLIPFSYPIENLTIKDSLNSGSVTINGTMSGNISDDFSSMTQNLTFDETFSSFTVTSEKKNYTCSGTIRYVSDMTMSMQTGNVNMTTTVKGKLTIKGTNYSQTADLNLSCIASGNAQGINYTVTGTVDGDPVNYTLK